MDEEPSVSAEQVVDLLQSALASMDRLGLVLPAAHVQAGLDLLLRTNDQNAGRERDKLH